MPAAAHSRRRGAVHDSALRRLIVRPGAIGDCIVSLPAMEFLRAEHTEVWGPTRNLPLIRFADRVRSLTLLDTVGVTRGAPPELDAFDDIVAWYGSNRPEFRDAVSHLPFRFFPALPDETCHAVDFYSRQVGAPVGAWPRIAVDAEPQDFIAVHPFSGSAKKNWPLEKFVELAERLPVRFCIGEEQRLDGAVHLPDLYDLARWLRSARLYIGNDSGITQLAAAVGTPVIALFGPTDPKIWAPRGSTVIHRDPIDSIAVDEVAELVRRETRG